jgi:hypothetical protein
MENLKAIIDYADEDKGKELRDVLYSELQNRVMAHIEAHKQVVAASMFDKPEETEVQTDTEEQGN